MNRPAQLKREFESLLGGGAAPAEGDEARQARQNVMRVWAAIRRRWWLPLLTTTLLLGLYLTYKLVLPPVYQASGLVQLGMFADMDGARQRGDWAPARGAAFETHRQLLTSHSVVEAAILASGAFLAEGAQRQRQREDFLEDITIEPLAGTYLVVVSGKGHDAAQVARNVNGLMDAFIPFTNEFRTSRYRMSEKLQREKEAKVLGSLQEVQARQRRMYESIGNVQFQEVRTNMLQTQRELQGRLTGLRLEHASVDSDRERLLRFGRDVLDPKIDVELLARRLRLGDGRKPLAREAVLARLEAQLVELRTSAGESHPQYLDLTRKIEAERTALRADLRKAGEADLAAVADRETTLAAEEAKLTALVSEVSEKLANLDRQEGKFSSIRREVEWYDSELEQTRVAIRQLQSLVKGDHGGAVIVNRAEEPTQAERRFKVMNFMFVALLTLGFGMFLVIAWDHLDDAVSHEDRVTHLGLPILGRIPMLSFRDVDELAHLKGSSWLADACSLIRTNMSVAAGTLEKASVLVTSGSPGDGKSLVSCSLATSLAASGQRTLLIEADMRAPGVQLVFGTSYKRGLSDVLQEKSNLKGVIQASGIDNLFLLPAGPRPSKPADLLAGGQFERVLKEALETYDNVVVDAPPAQPLADTSLMARVVTGVVHVVRMHESRRTLVGRGVEQIRGIGARNLGIVLNHVSANTAGYTYGNYYTKGNFEPAEGETLFAVGALPPEIAAEEEGGGRGPRFLLLAVVLLLIGIPTGLAIAGHFKALPADLQESFDRLIGPTEGR